MDVPTNVILGNTAQFVAEFLDSDGELTVPSGGTLQIDYPTGLTTTTQNITMTLQNSFFTGTWSSSVSSLGLAGWSIFAAGSTATAASTGVLRIITP